MLQQSLAPAGHSWGIRVFFSSLHRFAPSCCKITRVGVLQAKLQLQIFRQELFSAILEVFSPLLCNQVVALGGERAGFSCSLCPALAERCRQWEGWDWLPSPACCPWEIKAGFGAKIWDLRLCSVLQDGFAEGCGRLRCAERAQTHLTQPEGGFTDSGACSLLELFIPLGSKELIFLLACGSLFGAHISV